MYKKVAFLATGDEIVNGDILNTNGQVMAQALFDKGVHLGMHMVVSDDQDELEAAMRYLLDKHDALITTGGLGPTSDDRTRFALANTLSRELEFDESVWEAILARFKKFKLKNQPESNRNQALFPKGASIIENNHGTAAGCYLEDQGKLIFMLPGPPSECVPMFEGAVEKMIMAQDFATAVVHRKWLLFGLSEGQIADELDRLAEPFDITTGYRMRYPYIEFKAHAEDPKEMEKFEAVALARIKSLCLGDDNTPASDRLKQFIAEQEQGVSIDDQATRGRLQKALFDIHTADKLDFKQGSKATFHIEGLAEIWQAEYDRDASLSFTHDGKTQTKSFPNRGQRSINYAVELICQLILDGVK